MQEPVGTTADETYAMSIANGSYEWYKKAAIRARRGHRLSEIGIIVLSALIPAAAALFRGNTTVPAILGALVVVLSGLRALFRWHENYLRFSRAREAVEAERRRYRLGAAPYDDRQARELELAANVTRIEQEEMNGWVETLQRRPNNN